LTRLLVACPAVVPDLLADFLTVNDAYVLEGVLVAVWGLVIDGRDHESGRLAAGEPYQSLFVHDKQTWCHITIRHYVRCIVEKAHERGWLSADCIAIARPPYRSTLPLDQVPDKAGLEALDSSRGFKWIIFSCTDWDFFRYTMGGNWRNPTFF